MIHPIVLYRSSILRRVSKEISEDYKDLDMLISDMFDTMKLEGVGLAAPQIGLSIRIFVIDTSPLEEDDPALKDFKKVFINPTIIEETGKPWLFNEGCLSIPGVREDISRPQKIRIQYYDENFRFFDEHYDGVKARIMQHEYDHLQGILFTDRLQPLKKRMLKGKLMAISKGKVPTNYKVRIEK